MNGQMKVEVREQTERADSERGCGDNCQGKEREGGGEERQIGRRGKKGAERLGDMKDRLAVRCGVMMADRNHCSDPPPSTHTHTHTHTHIPLMQT